MKISLSRPRIFTRFVAAALASLFLFPAFSASAAVVFQDNFDAEGPGSILSYTGFANWTVTGGEVDIIAHGGFSIGCVGASGSCVDMDGTSTQAGRLTSAALFGPGNYILSFDISGNQRNGPTDSMTVLFGDLNETFNRAAADPFGTVTRTVTVGPGGDNIVFAHDNHGQDQLGIILDNVLLETGEAVTIAAPGAALILLFGSLALSRRRHPA